MTATRIRLLQCGRTSLDYEMAVTGDPERLMRQSAAEAPASHEWLHHPIYAFVIEHPEGRILLDTGVSPDFRRRWKHPVYPDLMGYKPLPGDLFTEQLEQQGYAIEDFDYVVLSHLHTDHAGNAELFRSAGCKIIVHEDEIRGAVTQKSGLLRDDDITLWGVTSPQGFVHREFGFLVPDRATTVYADMEIMRNVWTVSLPGHTWGSLGLAVKTEQSGWVLLAVDAMYLAANYRKPFVGSMLNHNQEQWAHSALKIRKLAEKYDMTIIPGHDDYVVHHAHDGAGDVAPIESEY